MKVAVWPADEGGCGYYRLIWAARALAGQGAEVDLRLPGDGSGLHGVFAKGDDGIERLVGLQEPPEADVVVLQRPLAAWRADLVGLLQEHGVRVVVEIDDDFSTIHPRNVSFRSVHPRHNPGVNREHLARACRQADLVTVTTPVLASRYGGHGRVAIIPNFVPAWYLDVVPEPWAGRRIGWTGSLQTHPTDLQVTRGAVARAAEATEAVVTVVGTGAGVADALGLTEAPEATGWLPIDEYPRAMARADVGIVPLDDITFNHAKSRLKALEYAALGVPVVMSPTADNVALHGLGVGLVARKPKHWAAHLRRLLTDPAERAELAAAGRAAARALTIEGNADRWWDAWASTVTTRRAA